MDEKRMAHAAEQAHDAEPTLGEVTRDGGPGGELPAADDGPAGAAAADGGPAGVAATVGTAAVSTLLAASLVGALSEPPDTRLVTLPEPTPIVRVYQDEDPEEPIPEPEDEAIEETFLWRRLLKLLKYLLVALLLVATIVFGALRGCASCAAGQLVGGDDERQEQQAQPA